MGIEGSVVRSIDRTWRIIERKKTTHLEKVQTSFATYDRIAPSAKENYPIQEAQSTSRMTMSDFGTLTSGVVAEVDMTLQTIDVGVVKDESKGTIGRKFRVASYL